MACWGYDESGQATPPQGEFVSVSAGLRYTCGVRTGGSVACWGYDESGQATPLQGEFASVSAGSSHTCGVRADGSVACWGYDDDGESTPPGGVRFRQLRELPHLRGEGRWLRGLLGR